MSSIKKDLAKNTIWNSVERFSNMGIQLLCTFILARYLTPSDYGIIGMYNPQNEMFRLLGTKRSFSQNETFFFSHPYPALFRLISHF